MLTNRRTFQRGDTLIEVLFAITVFSLVAVGSLSIMNQGTTTAQRSLEITLVRQEIDAQAETLRFIHDSYVATHPDPVSGEPSGEWRKIVDKSVGVAQASTFGTCTPPSTAFIVNSKTAKLEVGKLTSTVPTYAQLRFSSTSPITVPATTTAVLMAAEGIWVEAVQSSVVDTTGFVDFHIRACWDSIGQAAPMTLGTIVRLYEPRI